MTDLSRRSFLAIATAAATTAPAQAAPVTPATSGARAIDVVIKPAAARLRAEPAGETPVVTFDAGMGRVLARLKQGEPSRLSVTNGSGEPLSLHLHGLRAENTADGIAGLNSEPIGPGATRDIAFTPPDAGLIIVRSGMVGRSAEQTERGLNGLIVVDEAAPPPVDRDIVCAIDDIRLDPAGQLSRFRQSADVAGAGRLGNLLLVNGAPSPLEEAVPAGGRIRLRLANVSVARIMRIRFDNLRAWVAAVDGQATDTFEPLRAALPLAPGSRYEVMVEAPADVGAIGAVTAMLGDGVPLVRLTTSAEAGQAMAGLPPIAAFAVNPGLPDEIKLQRAFRAELLIEGGATPGADGRPVYNGDPATVWRVNGARGTLSPPKPVVRATRHAAVVLTLVNKTAWPQPMHLHGHVFRLLHNFDDGWEPYWLDTVTVPPGQTQRIAFVADNPGRWLIGSTILDRLDAGLFAVLDIS